MVPEIPRFFQAVYQRYLYRVYVTPVDLLFVKLGARIDMYAFLGGGVAGAAAELERERQYQRELEEEGDMLKKRGLEGIRIFIRANKRGFCADPDDLDEVRIDAVGKWKRIFFCKPVPALLLNHRKLGKFTFLFPQQKDLVIAIYELETLLGATLEIGLDEEDFKKGLKKYKKLRES